jgi:hypothetical protein
MLDAPRQNWQIYEAKTRSADALWLRDLTPNERFALYCDMFDLIHESRDPTANWERLDQWRWRQKLAARRQVVEAFHKMDALSEPAA